MVYAPFAGVITARNAERLAGPRQTTPRTWSAPLGWGALRLAHHLDPLLQHLVAAREHTGEGCGRPGRWA